jgi:hypothetical protein
MKIKIFLAQIWAFVSSIWKKASDEVKLIAPLAVNAVNVLKSINESFVGDIVETVLAAIIPGKVDDMIIHNARVKLQKILPKVIIQLNIANSISKIQDPNEQLKAILVAINMSSDETKNIYYHSLCVLILQSLADGKLTWSESVQISEYYYSNIYKK